MRLKAAHSCRRCRFWLEGEWGAAAARFTGPELAEYRAGIQAQMDAGECWACQGERLRAAEAYLVLSDQIRELTNWGVPIPSKLADALRAADAALTDAGLGGYVSPFLPPRPAVESKETR